VSVFAPSDIEVRNRIRTDVDNNVCVEAGAGTGKTTVLVSRIVELLRTGVVDIDEIAVITFTEAAAAELAARVRQELEEALAGANDEDRGQIHAALQGLHRARVETIHAFAASLLRERPVEAELDPGFEVLDGLAAQLSFDEAYSAWLAELLDGPKPEIVAAIGRGFQLSQLRTLVEEVHRHRALLPLTREVARPADFEALRAELREAVSVFDEILPCCREDDDARADMQAIAEWRERLAAVEADEPELVREILFRAPDLTPGAGAQRLWDDPDGCRRSKHHRKAVHEAIQRVRDELRSEAFTALVPIAEEFVEQYECERKAAGTADFDDLLEWARELLVKSAEARAYFRRRFRAILVDEFQDTDPVQAEIALLIASDDEPTGQLARADTTKGRPHRRRRPQAVDLPVPSRGHRGVRRRPPWAARRHRGATRPELPVGQGRDRLGQRRVQPGTRRAGGRPAREHRPPPRPREARGRDALGLRGARRGSH